ncbi:Ubiquitin carboxyl-terminal hydrolase 8 [Madurella mycetomatis]|uniref:Ubiquitin carboxyl-terminal hydrolase 8 n=1 Tax=Madurella mycetomatis TaxID=100816 RepID=A0A150ASC4_9PEZI|nr:Ubiquitin carboxyl-terminal hydrolase 8 [Madurella mycetomatis]
MAGSTTLLGQGGPAPLGAPGDGHDGAKVPKRPLPHIDDIVSVTVDLEEQAPIEKILVTAENCLRQAVSCKNFGRPVLALQDYLRANIILVNIIPRNMGWPSLQAGNKTQYERYQRLLHQAHTVHDDFKAIKSQIKADNARTGVQPTVRRPASAGGVANRPATNGTTTGQENGVSAVMENGAPARPPPSPPKTKPVVHPKPQSLHGKALRPGAATSSASKAQDLAQRFANLRPTTAEPQQDPRIRTVPIIPPKMSGAQKPFEGPSPSLSAHEALAGMPQPPAAIYNPPRGTISSEAAELPSSAPRAMFTRTSSTASLSTTRNIKSPPPDGTTSPVQTNGLTNSPAKRTRLSVPDGESISVEDLLRFMRAGAKDLSILLIDIRNREEFDDGHIMSQATICLEPEVVSRPDISANQIADSMVLAPPAELLLFEKRHEFDLVVFYDQDSEQIAANPQTAKAKAVHGLFNALTQYDFLGAPGKTSGPKLLRGGLNAWTSLIGNASLQSSSTAGVKRTSATPMARSFLNPRQKYITRPIQDAEEARRWEDTIADVGAISPIRTTEDFLRRYPSISEHRESMISPVSPPPSRPQSPFQYRLSHEENLYTSLPPPPTCPPPALPRRSYSGLAEAEDNSVALAKRSSVKPSLDQVRKFRTGLHNPGVFCFANSSLQAMFATPGFAREIWAGDWKAAYKVPMKPDEQLENPQLLMKCLTNLFYWLNQGTFPSLKAKTFMDYIHFIHSKTADGRPKPSAEVFGGHCQQDAQEFYSFIMDNIHDETNTRRDRQPSKEEKPYTPKDGTIIQNAMDYWRDYSTASASIVDKYFRGLEVFISRCHNSDCRQEIRLFQPCDVWILNLAGASDPADLDSLLANHQTSEHFPDLICETCNKPGRTRKAKFARFPDRLAFCLNRFHNSGGGGLLTSSGSSRTGKIHTKVRFPIRDLDLTRYCAEPDPDMASTHDAHFAGRMKYDCYAVTVHVGQGINGGHYYSYVQDELSRDPTDWFRCNDEVVDRVKIGSGGGSGDLTETMYQNGNASAYMVYYRRQGT